jgi:pre-mRNA-splicing factor SPF27
LFAVQKSSQLAELLANYANNPIKAIDPSKYAPPSFTEDDDLERLKEIEARGRIGEGHMALRCVHV